jgi:hypothetical protein
MKRYSLLLPTLLLLAVSACTKDELVPERTETTVTATGVLARSAAGEVTVRVAAGAIPAGTTLSITTLRSGQPAGVVGPMFELDTEPRVSAFTGSVELEILNPQPSTPVVLANLDAATPVPVAGAIYDVATARARGTLAHFSRYGLWTTTATLSCPSDQPVPGSACSVDAAECRYGQECCCGSCYPSLSCSCVSGQWACLHTDACLGAAQCQDAGVTDSGTSTVTAKDAGVGMGDSGTAAPCPSEAAVIGASCSSGGQICEYGVESCCGQSFPALHCMCDGSSFACFATDACLSPACNAFRESEPNDTRATADELPSPLPSHIEGATRGGDLDWFRLVNTSTLTARFVVDLSTLTSTLAGDYVECHDLVISRYDSAGVALDIASSVRGQPCPSLEYDLPLGAINYLLVHTSTPSAVAPGDYFINLWPR